LVALLVLLLLTANILEYKSLIAPVVDVNVVIAAVGVVNDGNDAEPDEFIDHDEAELLVFI
jgi:hypothetical protein